MAFMRQVVAAAAEIVNGSSPGDAGVEDAQEFLREVYQKAREIQTPSIGALLKGRNG